MHGLARDISKLLFKLFNTFPMITFEGHQKLSGSLPGNLIHSSFILANKYWQGGQSHEQKGLVVYLSAIITIVHAPTCTMDNGRISRETSLAVFFIFFSRYCGYCHQPMSCNYCLENLKLLTTVSKVGRKGTNKECWLTEYYTWKDGMHGEMACHSLSLPTTVPRTVRSVILCTHQSSV